MSNKDKKSSENKGYSDLVNESIDLLNEEHSFNKTDLRRKVKKQQNYKIFKKKWFLLLCVLVAINIVLFGYYESTKPDPKSYQVEELKQYEDMPPDVQDTIRSIHETFKAASMEKVETPEDLEQIFVELQSSVKASGSELLISPPVSELEPAPNGGLVWEEK